MEHSKDTGRWRLVRIGVTALAVTMLVSAGGTTRAAADPFGVGPPDAGWFADNSTHTWCTFGSFVSAWHNPIRDSLINLDSQTDVSDSYVSVCTSDTDAQFNLSSSSQMGSNTLGSYSCLVNPTSTNRCGAARIRLNTDLLTDYHYRRKTSCHEVGHSVGLQHGPTYGGCMVSGYANYSTYSSHHVNHINSKY